ncbi:helix-turn-helix domain-containing protein [Nocardia sp. NPDC004722]
MGLMGTTPRRYLLTVRLERAAGRLADPHYRGRTISDIAFESGFSAISNFNREIRRKYGCSAGQLRRRSLG